MTLETILEPFQWADEKVRTIYQKIDNKIPDGAYYLGFPMFTVGAAMLITAGIRSFVPEFDANVLGPHVVFDGGYALAFLTGLDIKHRFNGPELAENPIYINKAARFVRSYARAVRFPMLIGTGIAAGKVLYDLASLAIGGEPLDRQTLGTFEAAVGLLVDSSFMYLRDQDSATGQKKRSPVKMLLDTAHALSDRVKGALRSPVPSPQPHAGLAYSTKN